MSETRDCENCKHYVETAQNKMFNYTTYGCSLWECQFERKGLIEVSRVGCCQNCQYYQTLYIPPLDMHSEVIKACGGTKNAKVCTALADGEANRVMYLGKSNENTDNGMCELYTEREEE